MSVTATLASHPTPPAETALARFLVDRAEALVSASALLGGRPAARRTAHLIEALTDAPHLNTRLRREVVELHRLLALDRVGDPASLESALFAQIDPESPVVEEICVLTDELREHLVALANAEKSRPTWEGIAAA
jgi:hypothetical protein